MSRIIINLLFSLFLISNAIADPSISGVSGDIVDGQTITISGSNFGSHSDYNSNETYIAAMWEDFDSGVADSDALYTQQPCGPARSTTYRKGGSGYSSYHSKWHSSKSYTNIWGDSCNSTNQYGLAVNGGSTRPKAFISGWFYWRDGYWDNATYGGYSTLQQSKAIGMSGPDAGQKIYMSYGGVGTRYGNLGIYWEICSATSHGDETYHVSNWEGQWVRIDMEVNWSTGTGRSYFNGKLWKTHSLCSVSYDDQLFARFLWGFYLRENPNGDDDHPSTEYWLDDIYLTYTFARVFISNQATYDNSSLHSQELQIPLSWSSSAIEIKVNQGEFEDGSTQYLYVVDSYGNVSSTGYSITFGDSNPDNIDPVVTIDSPTMESTFDNGPDDDLNICASITDAGGVASAQWSNALTQASGPATCTGTDTDKDCCAMVALNPGDNLVNFTGYDNAGNNASDPEGLTVTYTPPVVIEPVRSNNSSGAQMH